MAEGKRIVMLLLADSVRQLGLALHQRSSRWFVCRGARVEDRALCMRTKCSAIELHTMPKVTVQLNNSLKKRH